jgi:hypothetical protein
MLGAWTPDFTDSASPDFGSFLTCIMMMTIMIIMLNVLIALMGDTFSTARSMGLALWRKEQATVTFDQSFALSEDTIYVPPHIHVLQYTSDVAITVGTNNLVEMVEASKYHVMKFTDFENEESAAATAAATSSASGDSKLVTVSQDQLEALFAKFLEAQGVNASSVKRK